MAKRRLKKKVKRFLRRTLLLTIGIIVFVVFNKTLLTKALPSDINIHDIKNNIYLIKGEEYYIDYSDNYKYEVNNSNISFDKGNIKALDKGNSKIIISNDKEKVEINIRITDLLVLPTINNTKSYLKCHAYTEEEAKELDEYLEYRINDKGYQTRAGAVEAVRYLTMMFPYRLKYFYENGRLSPNDFFDYVDGEGRYYHKGLYLTDNKFSELKATLRGPNPWGCPIYNDTGKGDRNNGLDCSGFITWALYNAGYDPDDIGAGKSSLPDLTDLGTIMNFDNDDSFNKVKVGDLVGRQGHIAMLIGFDGTKYYIGEALDSGEYDMHVYSYTKSELIESHFEYFIDMDEYYKEDGKLTNMW